MTRPVVVDSNARRRGRGQYTAWRRTHTGAEVERTEDGRLLVRLATTGCGPTVDLVLSEAAWAALVRGVEAERKRRQMLTSEPRANSPEDIGHRRAG